MRTGKIEIMVNGHWADRTRETIGQQFVSDWFEDWDAQAAVAYHYHFHHGQSGIPPQARLVWTEISASSPRGSE